MTPELQTILNLLCGSAACCKEKDSSGDGHVGDYVVSVNHPDRSVSSVIVKNQFSPGKDTWSKWEKFSEIGLNIKTCDFKVLYQSYWLLKSGENWKKVLTNKNAFFSMYSNSMTKTGYTMRKLTSGAV